MHFTTDLKRRVHASLLAACALSLAGCGLVGGDDDTTPTVGNRVPILSRIDNSTEVDPALAAVAVTLPSAQENADWAQAGGNASKAMGHLALSDSPQLAWTARIAGATTRRRLATAPIVGGGTLYAIDTSAVVHAIDTQSGTVRWTRPFEVASDLRDAAFGGGVTFADGKLYGTNGIGDVGAFDPQSGELLWRVKPGGPLRGSPTVAFNQVFVMSQNNQIYALNQADGAVIWQESSSLGQTGVFGVAAPSAGQGTVIAGYSTGELTAYRYENGRVVWADALARTSISTEVGVLTDVDAEPIVDSNGRVYALGQGGRMAAYELITGQRVWELSLAGISTPALAGDWIFTLTDDARLLAIQKNTGKVRWVSQLQRYRDEKDRKGPIFWSGPVLAGNNLWAVSSRGELYRINVADGSATEYAKLDNPVSLPPIVAGGTLFLLDDGGKIYAYR